MNARARKLTGKMLLTSGVERGFLISYDSKGVRYSILEDLQNLRTVGNHRAFEFAENATKNAAHTNRPDVTPPPRP